MIILSMYALGLIPALLMLSNAWCRKEVSVFVGVSFVLPLFCWEALRGRVGTPGSLTNAFIEPFLLGVATSTYFVLAVYAYRGRKMSVIGALVAFLAISSLTAVLFAFLFPALRE